MGARHHGGSSSTKPRALTIAICALIATVGFVLVAPGLNSPPTPNKVSIVLVRATDADEYPRTASGVPRLELDFDDTAVAEAPPTPPHFDCGGCVVSSATIRGSLAGDATYSKTRYVFRNVWLRDNETLVAYLPPGVPKPKERAVDIVHEGDPEASLPTEVHYHKSLPPEMARFRIKYKTAGEGRGPRCARWEERPVFVLAVPHPINIWHVLNDALMGVFGTLREEGLLPLAEVDSDGLMTEYTADLEEECPWRLEVGGDGEPYRPAGCRPSRGLLAPARCSPKTDAWCRPGGLIAVNRTKGPVLLLGPKSAQLDDRWAALLDALSTDVRPWNTSEGTCFRELYVGKSNLLNFYMGLEPGAAGQERAAALREAALSTFQRVASTAERHRRALNATRWAGYNETELKVLRQGVGPEDLDVISSLRRYRTAHEPPIGNLTVLEDDVAELRRLRQIEMETTRLELVPAKLEKLREEEADAGGPAPTPPGPRPVVTFMWRRDYKRCVINEADVLEYILARYNVTVKVTTFEEPLLETMDLMSSTDVLIGMHGAGWTNALFLKPGAGALQLFPYGWQPPGRGPIRGASYVNVARAKGAVYQNWFNPFADYAFMRRWDWENQARMGAPLSYNYSIHPASGWGRPRGPVDVGAHWVYQNTLVNVSNIVAKVHAVMSHVGIRPMAVADVERQAERLAAMPMTLE